VKVVILAGGLGTRLAEETSIKPKPMVEIGEHPILWHIMKTYSAQGFNEFIIALGYKGHYIREYFLNYGSLNSDFTLDMQSNVVSYHKKNTENWKVTLVDTGDKTLTGGRLGRLQEFLKGEKNFMLTYGDGVSNVNLKELCNFHFKTKASATVTAVRPPARFGNIEFNNDFVKEFKEKPQTGEGWINGGYFVFSPDIFKFIDNDLSVLEGKPLESLSAQGVLAGYKHEGFWQCMDTLRDKHILNEHWNSGKAPWKVWH
jgi:glucose-1-phosphate cytidylyltransferase